MTTTLMFIGKSRFDALMMAVFFQKVSGVQLKDITRAPAENDTYIVAGDVDEEETVLDYGLPAMQTLSAITGNVYAIKCTDKHFRIYRFTMK